MADLRVGVKFLEIFAVVRELMADEEDPNETNEQRIKTNIISQRAMAALFLNEQIFVNQDMTLFATTRVSEDFELYKEKVQRLYPNHTVDPVDFTINPPDDA